MIEKDNIDSSDVPKDYFEDVTIEAAKERHLRFEVDERKRKKFVIFVNTYADQCISQNMVS